MDSVEVTFTIPWWVITALIMYLLLGLALIMYLLLGLALIMYLLLLGLALIPATVWFQTASVSPKPAALNRLWPHGSLT